MRLDLNMGVGSESRAIVNEGVRNTGRLGEMFTRVRVWRGGRGRTEVQFRQKTGEFYGEIPFLLEVAGLRLSRGHRGAAFRRGLDPARSHGMSSMVVRRSSLPCLMIVLVVGKTGDTASFGVRIPGLRLTSIRRFRSGGGGWSAVPSGPGSTHASCSGVVAVGNKRSRSDSMIT